MNTALSLCGVMNESSLIFLRDGGKEVCCGVFGHMYVSTFIFGVHISQKEGDLPQKVYMSEICLSGENGRNLIS